jgi:hypothetical protein
MRRSTIVLTTLGVVLSSAATAQAATLQVGPGKTYSKPCDAIAAASANDVIEVQAGTYTESPRRNNMVKYD